MAAFSFMTNFSAWNDKGAAVIRSWHMCQLSDDFSLSFKVTPTSINYSLLILAQSQPLRFVRMRIGGSQSTFQRHSSSSKRVSFGFDPDLEIFGLSSPRFGIFGACGLIEALICKGRHHRLNGLYEFLPAFRVPTSAMNK